MLVVITETIEQGHRTAASLLGQSIKKNPTLRLGLAAGNTPIGVYQSLVICTNRRILISRAWSSSVPTNSSGYHPRARKVITPSFINICSDILMRILITSIC